MTHFEFEASLADLIPPENCSVEIIALWWLRNRNWQLGYNLINGVSGQDAAWVRALMHRMEGDQVNARAGRDVGRNTIGQELKVLLDYFLD
mgnify:FL=1